MKLRKDFEDIFIFIEVGSKISCLTCKGELSVSPTEGKKLNKWSLAKEKCTFQTLVNLSYIE